jgi:hypothetical protein
MVMKTNTLSLASLFMTALLLTGEGRAQVTPPGAPPPTSLPLGRSIQATPQPSGGIPGTAQSFGMSEPSRKVEARKFDLDFPGGTPQQLVAAVEKATGEPLNAIIPDQDKDVTLPALKMRQVTVDDLFVAMEQGSRRTEAQVTGSYYSDFGGGSRSQYTMVNTSYGFRKVGTVWVFSNQKATALPDQVLVKTRFYQLDPYLSGHTVEDITTAIQTAWKMMGENKMAPKNPGTELKFHKETGLLIAVGDATQVQVIDDVLSALRPDLNPQAKPGQPTRKTNATPKTTPNEN